MADKKKGGPAKSTKARPVLSRQKTLLDLFTKKNNAEPMNEGMTCSQDTEIDVASPPLSQSSSVSQNKPLHPFFTKSSPPNSQEQPIVLVEEVIEILEDNELSTALSDKPPLTATNSLSKSDFCPSPSSSLGGRSREDPIVLESPPLKPALSLRPQPVAAFFTSRPTTTPIKMPNEAKHSDAPYPDHSSQHVRGPQSTFTSRNTLRSRPSTSAQLEVAETIPSPHPSLNSATYDDTIYSSSPLHFLPYLDPSDKDAYLQTIPKEHKRLHPAISRLANLLPTHTSPQLGSLMPSNSIWTEKWRPSRAEEVVGNEPHACYIRDWLRELELHFDSNVTDVGQVNGESRSKVKAKAHGRGTKRPRVLRAVERGRKRRKMDSDDEDDSWIVHSDEYEEEMVQMDEQAEDLGSEAQHRRLYKRTESDNFLLSRPSRAPPPRQPFTEPLCNTILLVGPPGSGKTAAVYACAEELGWEVFEVYPGIGKRNGANVAHLVGEVGKNHLVRKKKPRDDRNAFAMLLGAGQEEDVANKSTSIGQVIQAEDQEAHISADDFGFVSPISDTQSGTNDTTRTVRQSLILLEEVDILFKEDVNFWPAVMNFIKDCKRPVICTCNDVSLIPTSDLPLQRILTFLPCPTPIAVSYLQSLCCAEGYLVERESLVRLYESTYEVNSIDLPEMPVAGELPMPDLRSAILGLQLWCPGPHDMRPLNSMRSREPDKHSFEDLASWDWLKQGAEERLSGSEEPSISRLGVNHAELISFVDSHILRSPVETPEAYALHAYEASIDDELGHTIVFSGGKARGGGFQYYDRDEQIASTAIRLSRGGLGGIAGVENTLGARALFRSRVGHQIEVGGVLREVLPFAAPLQRRSIVHMEYEPWIRCMVAADDEEERGAGVRGGRRTRNSQRQVRVVRLTAESRRGLERTRIG